MANEFGGVSFPAALPGEEQAVTDPALDYTLAYLKAVLNADMGRAWGAVCPGSKVVRHTMAEDPERCEFVDNWCPALFLWAGDRNPLEQMADDWLVDTRPLRLLWIFRPAARQQQRLREPFINGFGKTIAMALRLGRHPSWVVDGDTDPYAATRGSVLTDQANLIDAKLLYYERADLRIQLENGGHLRPYEGIFASLRVRERLFIDPATYGGNVDGTTATAALELDVLNDDLLLVQRDEPTP